MNPEIFAEMKKKTDTVMGHMRARLNINDADKTPQKMMELIAFTMMIEQFTIMSNLTGDANRTLEIVRTICDGIQLLNSEIDTLKNKYK